jgi:hypothetical protein
MKQVLKTTILSLALVYAAAAQAQPTAPKSSASLADVSGSVLVNRGEQFVAGTDGDVLGAGDRVMAMEGSTATLRFDDGCDVTVEGGTVVTLDEGSPCAGWLLATEAVAPSGLAVGAGTAAGVSPWVYVPAGVLAAGLAYKEFEDDPSSP